MRTTPGSLFRFPREIIGKLGWACPLMVYSTARWGHHALVSLAPVTLRGVHHVIGCPSPCSVRDGSAAGCMDAQPDNVQGGGADQWVY